MATKTIQDVGRSGLDHIGIRTRRVNFKTLHMPLSSKQLTTEGLKEFPKQEREAEGRIGFPYCIIGRINPVNHGNVCTTKLWLRDFGACDKDSTNIIHTDPDEENERSNEVLVPTSSEVKSIMKNIFNYLEAHSNGEMNNRMNDIE
ncbi:hypothetical protein TNCV_2334441 [Trichonephila clavipes]|nr:hypothetical protein TNCV_2334441 [Trichonephila clavipes]